MPCFPNTCTFFASISSHTFTFGGSPCFLVPRSPAPVGHHARWENLMERYRFQAKGAAMLVLTRKRGESILVGETMRVSILAIDGERVKLGFTAPPEVPILREELLPSPSPSLEKDEHTHTI